MPRALPFAPRAAALLVAVVAPLAPGCVGSVVVDGDAGGFGAASSSAYVSVDLDGDTYHYFLLSSRASLCAPLRTAYEDLSTAFDEWGGDTSDDSCNTFFDAVAEAWDPLLRSGPNFIAVTLLDGAYIPVLSDLDDVTRPSEGTFQIEDSEAVFDVAYFEENAWAPLAESDEGCGDLDEPLDDSRALVESFLADTGDITVEGSASDGFRVDFEVAIEDENGDDAGNMAGGFGAQECDVELAGVDGLGFFVGAAWFMPWAGD